MRCCSEWGNLEIKTDPLGITGSCLLDTQAVVAAASTLPAESEIVFSESGNRLNWKCGEANGHWNRVQSDHSIPTINHTSFPWTPPATLASALRLAASACQAQAVSVGLYGIVLEPVGEALYLLSSNSIALAAVSIEKGTFPGGKITLRPPTPDVIATLIGACPNCVLDITNEGVFIKGAWLAAHLPLGIALQHDLKEVADQYPTATHTTKIDNAAVQKFIARARMLSDRHAAFTIGLRIEAGKLALTHAGISSSTEEFFMAEGLDPSISFESKPYPADMLLVALPHVETAVFDYLSANTLILKGSDPSFLYVVGGGE